jgi:hypothetical protein
MCVVKTPAYSVGIAESENGALSVLAEESRQLLSPAISLAAAEIPASGSWRWLGGGCGWAGAKWQYEEKL